MPIYIWVHEDTKEETRILRDFEDYETPPTKEETGEEDTTKWKRKIAPGIRVTHSNGWSPTGGAGKGNW